LYKAATLTSGKRLQKQFGSGLKHTDTTEIVVVDEAFECSVMHVFGFGEGEGFAHEASHFLGGVAYAIAAEQLPEAEGAVPTFHVSCLTCFFAY
jgi:hypothetical protein